MEEISIASGATRAGECCEPRVCHAHQRQPEWLFQWLALGCNWRHGQSWRSQDYCERNVPREVLSKSAREHVH